MLKHLGTRRVIGCGLLFICGVGTAAACTNSETASPAGGSGAIGGAGGASGLGGAAGTGGEASIGGTGGEASIGGVGGGAGSGASGSGGTAGTDNTAGINRVPAAQWCQRLAEIQCAGEAACCTDVGHKFGSEDECRTAQHNVCESTFRVATTGADARVAYDLDAVDGSLSTFETMTRQCDVNAATWGASPEGLITMFAGTKGSGQACTPTSMTDYAAGASCMRGLTCIPNTALLLSWTCSPRSSNGGPCYADVNCAAGLHCDEPQSRGMCVENFGDGTACSRATECGSLFCDGGHCVPSTANAGYCFKR